MDFVFRDDDDDDDDEEEEEEEEEEEKYNEHLGMFKLYLRIFSNEDMRTLWHA